MTVVGLITLLLGVANAVLGGSFIIAGSALSVVGATDPENLLRGAIGAIGGDLAMSGRVFLLLAVLLMLAGAGVLRRKRWGQALTFLLAVLAIPWALLNLEIALLLGAVPVWVAFLAIQVLYALLASSILIKKGAEFSRAPA